MKQLIYAMIIALLPLSQVAAKSAANQDPAAKEEIVFWHVDADLPEALIVELSEEFSQSREYTVKPMYIPFEEIKGSLVSGAMNKQTPDVALVPSDFVGLAKQMRLSVLEPSLLNDKVTPAINQTTMLHDVQYGAPITGFNHLALFYNKKLVPNPATTWEELREHAVSLKEKDIRAIGWNYKEPYWLVPFLGAFGGWPMDGDVITLDTTAMRDTLKFYKQLSDDGLVLSECGYDCAFDRFVSGEFAYAINGTWAYKDMEKALGDNFGVAVLPKVNGSMLTPMFTSHALIFPGESLSTAKGKTLREFIQFMQSEEVQYRWFNKTARLPVLKAVADKLSAHVDSNTQNLLLQQKVTRSTPTDPNMAYAWEGIRKGLERYSFGTVDDKEAALIMQRLAEKEKVAAAEKP